MKKVIRLTESDLTRLVKRVIKEQSEQGADLKPLVNEQKSPMDLGFKKWGDGFIIRLPKSSSSPKTDSIRIHATPSGEDYDVIVAVQGNKRVRSEIKGIKTFNEIENLLGDKFKKMDNVFDIVSGRVSMNTLQQIYNKLSSLKIDDKNNLFLVNV